jgi:dienelactone hydrolase
VKNHLIGTCLTLLLLSAAPPVGAQVTVAEQRLSRELAAAIRAGTVVRLGEDQDQFLGIFSPAQSKKSRGGIILLHDINNHADWPEVISPLRRRLPRFGWNTLSIQLPLTAAVDDTIKQPQPGNDSLFDALEQEIDRRIQAAIAYCHQQRIFNIILLGHQFGAIMASRYAAHNPSQETAVSALVALNLYSPVTDSEKLLSRDILANLNIAFFEVVPGESSTYVLQQAKKRRIMMNQLGHDKYKQIHIMGADYTFSDVEITLASRIQGWLAKLAPNAEAQTTDPMGHR